MRHCHSLGGRLALELKHFAILLDLSIDDSRPIFAHIFDTDSNDLVDT